MKTFPVQFIHSFNKYLPSISDLPGSVLGEDFSIMKNSMYPHAVYVVTGKTDNELTNK